MRRAALLACLCATAAAPAAAADPFAQESLMGDIAAYVERGPEHHRTASAADAATRAWLVAELSAAGLAVGEDAYRFLRFTPHRVGLDVEGVDEPEIAPYFYSGTTGPAGRTAALVDVGLGTAADVARSDVSGKIAVVRITYVRGAVDQTFDGAFAALSQAGAAAVIGVTNGPADLPVNRNVDSRLGMRSLPTVFVGKETGRQVLAAAQAGRGATVVLDADAAPSCARNVYSVLEGSDPARVVVVGTPITGWDSAASERGSGVASLLAIARHFAALPREQRPATLVFVFTSGHEIGFLGLPVFIRAHPDWFAGAAAYVHLGASLAARDWLDTGLGPVQPLPTGEPLRALYVSENPLLQSVAAQAFARAQPLGNTPPRALNPGEQAYAYRAGVPIVSSSGPGYWFHTSGDSLAAVEPGLLQGMALSFRDATAGVAASAPGSIRAANAAAALGTTPPTSAPPAGAGPHEPEPLTTCEELR